MNSIERIRSVTEDRRADYLWETKQAARAVGCVPNKFGDWWFRTRFKLRELCRAMPGQTAAELAALIAEGIADQESVVSGPLSVAKKCPARGDGD